MEHVAMNRVDQELYSDPEFDEEEAQAGLGSEAAAALLTGIIDPEPYMSPQFYTFNRASHHLMVQCIMAGRHALPQEIKAATSPTVLASWRGVWKDRHEDTAYLTGWKRIQEKLQAQVDDRGNEVLFFKNNPQQFVPYIDQWQSIVQSFHADADLKHLGLKDTIERIKQIWAVGAKFYGIPEAFIRVCVAACHICNSDQDPHGSQGKRRRFEYTESIEVMAKDVPQRLQQLAAKHKVILCIRQKYIRFKPFLAEVKDYCCHRAGEPTNKRKSGGKKRNRLSTKRCGCGFRIRAIVPITNYCDKDKTFSYQEEGMAVFKLFAVHSGHDPGAQEGGIVINRVLDSSLVMELGTVMDCEGTESHEALLTQLHELRAELGVLEGRIGTVPPDVLNTISQELLNVTLKLKNVEIPGKVSIIARPEVVGVEESPVHDWGKDNEGLHKEKGVDTMVQVSEEFALPLALAPHLQRRRLSRVPKQNCAKEVHSDKFLQVTEEDCSEFVERSILSGDDDPDLCEDHELDVKECDPGSVGDDGSLEGREGSLVGIHENYYHGNDKWYEGVSCSLDPSTDCSIDMSHSVHSEYRTSIS
ncbi:hypothetical protein O6H91_03G124700 [Diphasiastrum complanatum]|nr:hypothetical protein O6H91_03G124700 [Diphasiastrum complanatum]